MEEYTNKNDVGLDKDIILPAEKRITLEPIHDDVHVDDESDVQIAASHANGAPIGNISSDYETTGEKTETMPQQGVVSPQVKRATPSQPKRRVSYVSIVVMAVVIVACLFALLYR